MKWDYHDKRTGRRVKDVIILTWHPGAATIVDRNGGEPFTVDNRWLFGTPDDQRKEP